MVIPEIWLNGDGGPKCCSLAVLPSAGLQAVCGSSSVAGERLCRPSLILVAVLSCRLLPAVTQRKTEKSNKVGSPSGCALRALEVFTKG